MRRTAIKNKEKEPKKKNRVWLKKDEDVRRLLSSTINELRREEIKPEIASKIGYLCNILLGVISTIRDRGLEERLQILEKRVVALLSRKGGSNIVRKDLLKRMQAIEDVVFESDNTAEEIWDFLVRAELSVPNDKPLNKNQRESEFCRYYNINKEDTIAELRERIQLSKIQAQFQR